MRTMQQQHQHRATAYPVINLGVDVVQVGENSSAERVLTVGHTVVEHTSGC
jgi:hypothetical protein